jgi:hypothetical protein
MISVTVYVDNNCSGNLPALDRNCLCGGSAYMSSVLADALLACRPNSDVEIR